MDWTGEDLFSQGHLCSKPPLFCGINFHIGNIDEYVCNISRHWFMGHHH